MTESSAGTADREVGFWEEADAARALAKYDEERTSLYARRDFASVRSLIPRPRRSGARALDYGCGGGHLTAQLAQMGYQVTAADISSCSLAACQLNVSRQALHAVKLIQISAPDYYANIDGDFDVIVAKDVIEHIQDDVAFLRAMAGRLRADGCLVLVTQNDHSWNYVLEAPRELAKNPCWCGWHPTEHVRFYNKPRLKGLLWAVGLRPVAWRSVYLLPYQAFRGYFPRRARNFVHKLAGEAAFYWPDRILGGIWPFNGLGWSIQVKAVKADPCCHNSG